MRVQTVIIASVLLLGVSCSDEKPLRGWKNSDVEVINEGTASGSSTHVVAPGESFEPMTSTDVDTTTVTDIVGTGTLDEGEFVDEGSLASTLELDEEGRPVSGSPPETRTRRAAPPQPSPRPSPGDPAGETRRSPEPANDPAPVERREPTEERPTRDEPEAEPEPEPEEEPPTEEEEPPSEEPNEDPADEADSFEESIFSS